MGVIKVSVERKKKCFANENVFAASLARVEREIFISVYLFNF